MGNKNAREGKLVASWEGPYRVTASTGIGAYILESLGGLPIPRTWNDSIPQARVATSGGWKPRSLLSSRTKRPYTRRGTRLRG
ncbi:hypothetical protein MTR_5g042750 [Medicago truncatula]|uniref:Uncharacterized protein n=1 Tax=Medicago truncatula TaxID=3880 RepID=G7JWL4_MEDTR|nr:hypothetical protein MTR_5g042750 [Medicago truncatula]